MTSAMLFGNQPDDTVSQSTATDHDDNETREGPRSTEPIVSWRQRLKDEFTDDNPVNTNASKAKEEKPAGKVKSKKASTQIIDILSQKSREDKLNEGIKMRPSEYVIEKMKQQKLM